LVVAAFLKTHQSLQAPQLHRGALATGWLRLTIVESEMISGIALLFGVFPHKARRFCQLLFSVFIAFSTYSLFSGIGSCGCLGYIDLQPWLFLVLNSSALVALSYWRPAKPAKPGVFSSFPLLFAFPLLLALVPVCLELTTAPRVAALDVIPDLVTLEDLAQAANRDFDVLLRNKYDEPITVHRLAFSCSCLQSPNLQFVIGARQDKQIRFRLDLRDEPTFVGDLLLEVQGWTASDVLLFSLQIKARIAATQ
jgi:hypothetical protein